jgi:pantoate--beta-alanine ligase
MGYFHDGHLSLMRRAREDTDLVVVSLFVNPAQFGPGEDFKAYPRDEERDEQLAEAEGVDVLFAPAVEEVYPDGFDTTVVIAGITETLEGDEAQRGAEHFQGVATVVTKLFNMVAPDVAYFGQKDAQQALVIRKLVRDLDIPVEIEVGATVREPDGLALSSRNARLNPEQRRRALALRRALDAVRAAAARGERDAAALAAAGRAAMTPFGVEPEYFELVAPDSFTPVDHVGDEQVLVAVAARVGDVRLIDNDILEGGSRP